MSLACVHMFPLLSTTGMTATTGGEYLLVPKGLDRLYIKYNATETAAGSITVFIFGFEDRSGTNAVTLDFRTLTATGTTRIVDVDVVGGPKFFPVITQAFVSPVTGTWDLDVELWYSLQK